MYHVIGIDLGTSGCRSAVFDETLRMLSTVSVSTPIIKKTSKEIEQDADDWWCGIRETLPEAVRKAGISKGSIRAISISSQSITIVPVNEQCKPLSNAISWLDTRASVQLTALQARFGNEYLYRRSGKRASAIYSLPKWMWMQQEMGDLCRSAHKMLLPLDFLIFKLCGKPYTDHTCASGTMYYDVQKCDWNRELLTQNGLETRLLPELVHSGTPVGTLLPEVAEELDLLPSTLVVMGGQDQKCASFGAQIDVHSATVSLGTAGCIEYLIPKPEGDAQCRIPLFSYLFKDSWVMEGLLSTCGICYNWLRDILGSDMSFERMDSLISESQPLDRTVFFYPYLSGESSPNWNEDCGIFYGLSLATRTGHLARSVLEGIAYAINSNLLKMEKDLNSVSEIRLFGGGSKSSIFCQIISDICNKDVLTCQNFDAALCGAAKLALLGAGLPLPSNYAVHHRYTPNQDHVKKYKAEYREYEAFRVRAFSGGR